MTKLTTERLEQYAHDKHMCNINDEIREMAQKLLAYEQAADRPVGKIFRCSGNKTLRWWNDVPEGTVLYAAPVLPKQPVVLYIGRELISKEGLELIRDGISEATNLESACMANTILGGSYHVQPVIPDEITSASAPEVFEIAAEAERLGIRGTYGSYAVGWNAYRAEMLKAQQNEPQNIPENIPAIQLDPHVYRELVNELRDVALEYHSAQQLRERISRALSKAVTAAHPHLEQPVSEPYKLEIDMDDADHFSITHLHEIIYGKELIWPEAKLLARFMLDVKQRASAAPAQESE